MGKKSLFYPCVIALALLLLSWNSGECRPKCPQVLPGNYGGVFGGNGQKFGYARSSLWSYASQWAFVFVFNRWLGREIRKSNFKHWLEHVTTFPEIPDGDHWTTNYIGHPLLGASIYAFYKNRGFSDKASLVGTLLQSTLFEYTVEAWEKPPSGVDLVVTPIIGSFIGSHVGMRSFIFSSTFVLTKYIFRIF